MKKNLVGMIVSLVILTGGLFFINTTVVAASGVSNPTCHLRANPNEIKANEGTTLIWWTSGDVVEVSLYPKNSTHLIKTFSNTNGWWWISGIVDSRDYTLVVKNGEGESASCDAHVEVVSGDDNDDNDDNGEGNNGGDDDKDKKVVKKSVVSKKVSSKSKYSGKDKKKYKSHKKYRGSVNKAIYKKIKGWKKHNVALYLKYKAVYKKHKGTSSKKLEQRLTAAEYSIYREYNIYHEYKEYKKLKKKLNK